MYGCGSTVLDKDQNSIFCIFTTSQFNINTVDCFDTVNSLEPAKTSHMRIPSMCFCLLALVLV